MKKDIIELAGLITMGLVPKILATLEQIEIENDDKIESWDFNQEDLTVYGKLKYSQKSFVESIN